MTQRHATRDKQQYRQAAGLFARCCLLLVACCLTGCVRRSLTIRTDPPGALVYLNDALKGPSPVTFDFLWYGTHRVILKKDGFERVEELKKIRAPIYLWIPMDFVMEALPVPIKEDYTWAYTLTPIAQPPAPVAPDAEIKTETPNDTTG